MDACFFQVLLTFSPVSVALPSGQIFRTRKMSYGKKVKHSAKKPMKRMLNYLLKSRFPMNSSVAPYLKDLSELMKYYNKGIDYYVKYLVYWFSLCWLLRLSVLKSANFCSLLTKCYQMCNHEIPALVYWTSIYFFRTYAGISHFFRS